MTLIPQLRHHQHQQEMHSDQVVERESAALVCLTRTRNTNNVKIIIKGMAMAITHTFSTTAAIQSRRHRRVWLQHGHRRTIAVEQARQEVILTTQQTNHRHLLPLQEDEVLVIAMVVLLHLEQA